MNRHLVQWVSLLPTAPLLLCMEGCVPPPKPPKDSLTLAIEERAKNPPKAARQPAPKKSPAHAQKPVESVHSEEKGVATIGSTQIGRDFFYELLIRSRGVSVLDQFIGLAAAQEFARQKGVSITESDVEFEYDLALRRLYDPLALTTTEFHKPEAERLLDSILAGRQMSRAEFMLTIQRNAWLRKPLAAELEISESQLRDEYELAFGERVQVRHIQLSSLADVERINQRLSAGEEFSELAARHSTNSASARRGGLLDPFSVRDDHVALALREAAASLNVGEISGPVRVGEWYHLLQLVQRVPAETRDFEAVRPELQKRLEVRLTDARMRDVYEKLYKEATVRIHDPQLQKAFQATYPGRTLSPSE